MNGGTLRHEMGTVGEYRVSNDAPTVGMVVSDKFYSPLDPSFSNNENALFARVSVNSNTLIVLCTHFVARSKKIEL